MGVKVYLMHEINVFQNEFKLFGSMENTAALSQDSFCKPWLMFSCKFWSTLLKTRKSECLIHVRYFQRTTEAPEDIACSLKETYKAIWKTQFLGRLCEIWSKVLELLFFEVLQDTVKWELGFFQVNPFWTAFGQWLGGRKAKKLEKEEHIPINIEYKNSSWRDLIRMFCCENAISNLRNGEACLKSHVT